MENRSPLPILWGNCCVSFPWIWADFLVTSRMQWKRPSLTLRNRSEKVLHPAFWESSLSVCPHSQLSCCEKLKPQERHSLVSWLTAPFDHAAQVPHRRVNGCLPDHSSLQTASDPLTPIFPLESPNILKYGQPPLLSCPTSWPIICEHNTMFYATSFLGALWPCNSNSDNLSAIFSQEE